MKLCQQCCPFGQPALFMVNPEAVCSPKHRCACGLDLCTACYLVWHVGGACKAFILAQAADGLEAL